MTDVLEQLRSAQPMPRGERLIADAAPHRHNANALWWRLLCKSKIHALPNNIRAHAAPLALARERRRRERAETQARIAWARVDEVEADNAEVRMEELAALREGVGVLVGQNAALRAEVARLREENTKMKRHITTANMVLNIGGRPKMRLVEQARAWKQSFKQAMGQIHAAHKLLVHVLENARVIKAENERLRADLAETVAEAAKNWVRSAPPTREEVERAVDVLLDAWTNKSADAMDSARAALVALTTREGR
jgi:regulator of replication initiation timing